MPLKAEYFPESYNQLRIELSTYWPNLWKKVQWVMAFDWILFMEMMNGALDLRVHFTTTVAIVCTQYLNELQRLRKNKLSH